MGTDVSTLLNKNEINATKQPLKQKWTGSIDWNGKSQSAKMG